MILRHFAVAVIALAVAGCGKKEAPKPQEPTKVATAEPTKEPTKPADPEKPAEPTKPADPEKPAEPAKALAPADLKVKFEEFMALALKGSDQIGPLYADDAVTGMVDAPDMQAKGGAGAVAFYQGWFKVYPDFVVTPQLVLVGDHRVLAVVHGTGTQTGEMMPGMKPTGKKVGLIGAWYVVWNADGKIASDIHFGDQLTIMAQLGLVPEDVPHRPLLEKAPSAEAVTVLATGSDAEKARVELHKKGQVAINAKDMKTLEELDKGTADDIVFHDMMAPADVVGKEAFGKFFQGFLTANPDIKFEGDDLWCAGDYCVHQSHASATNSGEWAMGDKKMPASNKAWKGEYLEVQRFEGDKEKEFWLFGNGLAMAKQLGWMPEGGAAPKDAPAPGGEEKKDAPAPEEKKTP